MINGILVYIFGKAIIGLVNVLFAKANPLSKKLLKHLEPNSKHVELYHTLRKTKKYCLHILANLFKKVFMKTTKQNMTFIGNECLKLIFN